jgi:hypothetical protein
LYRSLIFRVAMLIGFGMWSGRAFSQVKVRGYTKKDVV